MNEVALNLASRWKRLGGAMIDGVISSAIIVPIMVATGVLHRLVSGESMTIGQQAAFFVVGWIIFLLLNGYLLFNRGQTIGKVALKTKIVDLNGNVPNFGKLLVFRYLSLGVISQVLIVGGLAGLVNVLFIFGKERRCVHDHLAGTRVVEV